MKRFYQIVGKKKGARRTGSRWWGVFGEVVFFSTLFLSGIAVLATILMLDVQAIMSGEWLFTFGKLTRCFIGVLLVVIGGYGIGKTVWTVGHSRERRGAMVSLAREVELLNELNSTSSSFPTIPAFESLSKHSGKHLRYQINAKDFSRLGLVLNALLTIGFVVVSTILVVHCVQSINRGAADWPAIFFAVAHLIATGWQIYHFIRTLLRNSGFGPTSIEIDTVPIRLGDPLKMYFSQTGRLRVQCVDVELICQEQSTFNQGTDTRTENSTVFCERIMRKRGVVITPDKSLVEPMEVTIPEFAMHSFRASNNQIVWKIVVTCSAKGWPTLMREFPIVVLPKENKEERGAA